MKRVKGTLKFNVELDLERGEEKVSQLVKEKKEEIVKAIFGHFLNGYRWNDWNYYIGLNETDEVELYITDYELKLKGNEVEGYIVLGWEIWTVAQEEEFEMEESEI